MAAKVNKKFVVMLVLGLVGLAALVVVGGLLAMNSAADLAKKGDAMLAKAETTATRDPAAAFGEFRRASEFYSMAVNKEQTNVEYLTKWRDTVARLIPPDVTRFNEQFNNLYLATRQLAVVQDENVDAQRAYLELLDQQVKAGNASRGFLQNLVADADLIIGKHEADSQAPEGWKALKRYRGMAKLRLLVESPDVKQADVDAVLADLNAALEANPNDTESLLGTVTVHEFQAERARRARNDEKAREDEAIAQRLIANALERRPQDPMLLLADLRRDLARAQIDSSGVTDMAQARELAAKFREKSLPKLDALTAAIAASDLKDVTPGLIAQFRQLEQTIDPRATLSRTEEAIRRYLEARPNDGEMIMTKADIFAARNEYATAMETIARVDALPPVQVGIEGLKLFNMKSISTYLQALWAMRAYGSLPADSAERPAALEKAKAKRDELAKTMPSDSPQMMLVDAYVAWANQEWAAATRLIDAYNRETKDRDLDALVLAAQVAMQRRETGKARDSIGKVLALQPTNVQAMLLLAELELSLQNYRTVESLLATVVQLAPQNQQAKDALARVRVAMNPQGQETTGDPIFDFLIGADRLQKQVEGQETAYQQMVAYFEPALARFNNDPRIVQAFATQHMRFNQREKALEVIREGLKTNPEHAGLRQFEIAVTTPDPIEAQRRMIEGSVKEGIDREVAIVQLYQKAGDREKMKAALAKARATDAADKRVIEYSFMEAIDEKQWDKAQAYVEQAAREDMDGLAGLSFRARLQAARGDLPAAVETMSQAAQRGGMSPEAWRLKGRLEHLAARRTESIESFRSALRLRPDDIPTINDLLDSLIALDRKTEALNVAREYERYAKNDAKFLDTWLSLEGEIGDRNIATEMRRRIAQGSPDNRDNNVALAELYIRDGKLAEARSLIERVRASQDGLDVVRLDAEWHWAQRDAAKATAAFDSYIASIPEDRREDRMRAHMAQAQWFLSKQDVRGTMAALDKARPLQDPKKLEVDIAQFELGYVMGAIADVIPIGQRIVAAGADSEDNRVAKRLAEGYNRTGKYDDALALLAEIKKKGKSDSLTVLLEADALIGKGDTAAAAAKYDEAVSLFPTDPVVFLRRGQSLMNKKETSGEAIDDFTRALQLRPEMWQALQYRALTYVSINKIADALRDLTDALRLAPENDDLLYGLVSDFVRLERPDDAMQLAEQALDRRPGDVVARMTIGGIFRGYGDHARSARFFKAAHDMLPDNNEVTQRYVDSLLLQQPPRLADAEIVLRKIKEEEVQRNPGFLMSWARLRIEQNRRQDAAQFATRALRLLDAKKAPQMLAWYSDMLALQREPVRLLEFLQSAEDLGLAQEWMSFFRGTLMLGLKQAEQKPGQSPQDGLVLLGAVARNTSYMPDLRLLAFRKMGEYHYGSNAYPQAEAVWREGTSEGNFPDDYEMLNNLGYLLCAKLNKCEEALPLAEKVAKAVPNSPEVLDTLGLTYLKLNRCQEALTVLKRAALLTTEPGAIVAVCTHLAQAALCVGDTEEVKLALAKVDATLDKVPSAASQEMKDAISEVRRKAGL